MPIVDTYQALLHAEHRVNDYCSRAEQCIADNDRDAAEFWKEGAERYRNAIAHAFEAIRIERNRSASVVRDDEQLAHLRDFELPLSVGAEIHLAQVGARLHVVPHLLVAAMIAERQHDTQRAVGLRMFAALIDGAYDDSLVYVLKAAVAFIEGGE